MRRIKSYNEWMDLLARFRGVKVISNCYMLPEELKRYIRNDRLSVMETEDALLLAGDEESYSQLWFYYKEAAGLKEVLKHMDCSDSPCIVRLISNERRGAASPERDVLEEAGFVVRDLTKQFCLRAGRHDSADHPKLDMISEHLRRARRFLERRGFLLEIAEYSEHKEVRVLRDASLDAYHFPYLTDEELRREYEAGHFQIIREASGGIAATHQYEVRGRHAFGHVVAVKEEYRSLGIGPVMVYNFLDRAWTEGAEAFYCWIISDNVPSLEMHGKIGFVPTGKQSLQLYRERQ